MDVSYGERPNSHLGFTKRFNCFFTYLHATRFIHLDISQILNNIGKITQHNKGTFTWKLQQPSLILASSSNHCCGLEPSAVSLRFLDFFRKLNVRRRPFILASEHGIDCAGSDWVHSLAWDDEELMWERSKTCRMMSSLWNKWTKFCWKNDNFCNRSPRWANSRDS